MQTARKKKEDKKCTECGTSNTPLWRLGPLGPKTMCNACGIKWKRRNGSNKKRSRIEHDEMNRISFNRRDDSENDSASESSDDSASEITGVSTHNRQRTRAREAVRSVYKDYVFELPRLPKPPIGMVSSGLSEEDVYDDDNHAFNVSMKKRLKSDATPALELFFKLASQELKDLQSELKLEREMNILNEQVLGLQEQLKRKDSVIKELSDELRHKHIAQDGESVTPSPIKLKPSTEQLVQPGSPYADSDIEVPSHSIMSLKGDSHAKPITMATGTPVRADVGSNIAQGRLIPGMPAVSQRAVPIV